MGLNRLVPNSRNARFDFITIDLFSSLISHVADSCWRLAPANRQRALPALRCGDLAALENGLESDVRTVGHEILKRVEGTPLVKVRGTPSLWAGTRL
jgi:hypothetical protein